MRKINPRLLLLAVCFATVAATSCNSASPSEEGSTTTPNETREGQDRPPQRAEFGLDVRPPNPSCVAPARPPAAGAVKFERVFDGVKLEQTISMGQPPGDPTRWFAASRKGKIVSFPAVNPPAEPNVVADVATLAGRPVETAMEGGFLGFAFHPKFATNGRVYVTWTTTDAGSPTSEVGYLASTDAGASFTSYTRILSFKRTRFEHNGGGIAFSKDGYLLLGFGDMANDTHGQRIASLSARILRIDVDRPSGGKAYGIPPSNPYVGGGEGSEPPEVFAKGVRNPFRISVDRETGEIWVGDVGQDTYEEVNRIERGGNYGWPCREGAHDYKATNTWLCPSREGLTEPIIEHQHISGGRSVTGGVIYRGNAIPGFQGTYVYGDFIKNELFSLSSASSAVSLATPTLLNENGPSIGSTHFAEDANGEIYVTSILDNLIYKLVPADPNVVSTFPDRLSKTGCVDPNDPKKPAPGVIAYGVNAPLWSDGAEKERFLALPDGKAITVGADGDLDLPSGSVLVKSFAAGGKLLETRLLVRHDDGEWAGYSYEWNDAQTDAILLQSGKTKAIGAGGIDSWSFPSRSECTRCHTAAAGRSLGLELGQLNRDQVYAATNRLSNQLTTLEHIGVFAAPLGRPASTIEAYPDPFGAAPVADRARAYLHGNCSMCHQPNGGPDRAPMDFRYRTPFTEAKACNVTSQIDNLGVADAKILAPGRPEASLISIRVRSTENARMPPLGSRVVDERGAALLDDWIRATTCP